MFLLTAHHTNIFSCHTPPIQSDDPFVVSQSAHIFFSHVIIVTHSKPVSLQQILVTQTWSNSCSKVRKRCTCLRPGPHGTETWLFSRYSTGWQCGLHADWTELTACVDQTMNAIEDSRVRRKWVARAVVINMLKTKPLNNEKQSITKKSLSTTFLPRYMRIYSACLLTKRQHRGSYIFIYLPIGEKQDSVQGIGMIEVYLETDDSDTSLKSLTTVACVVGRRDVWCKARHLLWDRNEPKKAVRSGPALLQSCDLWTCAGFAE